MIVLIVMVLIIIIITIIIIIIIIIIIKEAYVTDVAIPNSQNLHRTITDKLQMSTGLKEEFKRIWKTKKPVIPVVLSATVIIPTNYGNV